MDERACASPVADLYGTEHTEVPITAGDAAAALPHFVEHLDQPSVDALNTYLVSRAAAGRAKAAISGLGGDELFGGYSTFKFARLAARLRPVSRRVPAMIGRAASGMDESAPLVLRSAWPWRVAVAALGGMPGVVEQYARVRFLFDDQERPRLLSDDFIQAAGEASSRALLAFSQTDAFSEPARQMAYLDLTHYMADTLLRDTDVMSMSHSLEVRVPFLDPPLVEAVLAMPTDVRWGSNGQSKHLLRSAFGDMLPEAVTSRRKMGFGLPMDDWLRQPQLRTVVEECLSPPSVARRGLLRPEAVQRVIRQFYNGPRLHRNTGHLWQRLWLLVVLELWLRRHLDGTTPMSARCQSQETTV
jgi:asparagine synthase (glutamine-hydrolysing)